MVKKMKKERKKVGIMSPTLFSKHTCTIELDVAKPERNSKRKAARPECLIAASGEGETSDEAEADCACALMRTLHARQIVDEYNLEFGYAIQDGKEKVRRVQGWLTFLSKRSIMGD